MCCRPASSSIPCGLVLLACAWMLACEARDASSQHVAPDRVAPDRVAPEGVATAAVRAERRLFDGAPPTIPHAPQGASCTSCHDTEGQSVPELGFAPPSPHGLTQGLSAISNCRQCHVAVRTHEVFAANDFAGVRQDLRAGQRLFDGSPPVMPHGVLMRENCSACHSGPAAREEIRTDHPERVRCSQCHVRQETRSTFPSDSRKAES